MRTYTSPWLYVVSLAILVSASGHEYYSSNGERKNSYDTSEPSWPFVKRRFQRFKVQSPNDILTGRSKSDLCLAPLCIQKSASLPEEAVSIKNTGYTLEITLLDHLLDKRPTITGGPLFDDCYLFEQMHFHWGRKDSCGSEHRVNGRCYAMEVHLVYFKEDYGSFEAAKNFSDGVTVITFFGEHSKHDNPDFVNLVSKLANVREPSSETRGSFKKEFRFVKVLLHQHTYYSFPGSLTTPNYQECVTWIMYTNPFPISSKQLEAFRRLKRQDGQGMIRENDRELQPFGDRPIITPLIKDKLKISVYNEPNSAYFEEDECPPNVCDE